MKKLLIATGHRQLDDAIAQAINTKHINEYIFDFASYREGVMHKISAFNPDVVVLSEMLEGNTDILELVLEIKRYYSGLRVVFMTGADRKNILPLLITHNVYDFIASNEWKLDPIIDLIEHPNNFVDVQMYLPDYSSYKENFNYVGETAEKEVEDTDKPTQKGVEVSSGELTDLTKELSSTRINQGFGVTGRERVLFEQGEKIGSFPTLVRPSHSISKSSRPKRINDKPRDTIQPTPSFDFKVHEHKKPVEKIEEIKVDIPKRETAKPVFSYKPEVKIDTKPAVAEEEFLDGTYTDGEYENEVTEAAVSEITDNFKSKTEAEILDAKDEFIEQKKLPEINNPEILPQDEVEDEEEETEEVFQTPVWEKPLEEPKHVRESEKTITPAFTFPTLNTASTKTQNFEKVKEEPIPEPIEEEVEEVEENDMFTCDLQEFTPNKKEKGPTPKKESKKENKKHEKAQEPKPEKKTQEKPVKQAEEKSKEEPRKESIKEEVDIFTMKPVYKNYLFLHNIVTGSQTGISLAYLLAMKGGRVLYIVHSKYSLMKSISGDSTEGCAWAEKLDKLSFKLPKKAQVKGQVELYNYTGKRINEILYKIPFGGYDYVVMELDCSRYENNHLKEIVNTCNANGLVKPYIPINQDYVFMEFIANDRLIKFADIEYSFLMERFMLEGMSSNRIMRQYGKECIKIYDDIVKYGNTYNNKALMVGKEKLDDVKNAYKDLLKDIVQDDEEESR